jgi:hypothetical protein
MEGKTQQRYINRHRDAHPRRRRLAVVRGGDGDRAPIDRRAPLRGRERRIAGNAGKTPARIEASRDPGFLIGGGPFLAESARLYQRRGFLLCWSLRPSRRTATRVARVGPTRRSNFGRSRPKQDRAAGRGPLGVQFLSPRLDETRSPSPGSATGGWRGKVRRSALIRFSGKTCPSGGSRS